MNRIRNNEIRIWKTKVDGFIEKILNEKPSDLWCKFNPFTPQGHITHLWVLFILDLWLWLPSSLPDSRNPIKF